MKRDQMIEYLCAHLKAEDFQDYCVNGLQVAGSPDVERVVAGVSISRRLIEEAVLRKAQMILVHHGFFKGDIPDPLRLTGLMRDRLALLLCNDINVVGFHLPLDAHPEIGNNALACRSLGLVELQPVDVGYVGNLEKPQSLERFVELTERLYERTVQVFPFGSQEVRRVAVISGGSSPDWIHAAEAGADTYVCGDMREHLVRAVEEAGINVINAGHYSSEKLGIRALADLVRSRFEIPVEFVDIENPV